MFVNFDSQCMRIGSISLPVNDTLGGFAGSNLTESDLTASNLTKNTHNEFSSWSHPYLLGCGTKAYLKMASNDDFWRVAI